MYFIKQRQNHHLPTPLPLSLPSPHSSVSPSKGKIIYIWIITIITEFDQHLQVYQ